MISQDLSEKKVKKHLLERLEDITCPQSTMFPILEISLFANSYDNFNYALKFHPSKEIEL